MSSDHNVGGSNGLACDDATCHAVDRGGGTVLLMMVTAALMAAILPVVGAVGALLVDRHRTQNGADAVALAAVIGGPEDAELVAQANGVSIVLLDIRGLEARVVVLGAELQATARASKGP